VGPHTISFPRMEPAVNTPMAENPPYRVSDYDFKRLIAVIRLSVPYTGMILTARENPEIRREALEMGVSQIDAGSSIGIGSYSASDPEEIKKSQFLLGDTRPLTKSYMNWHPTATYLLFAPPVTEQAEPVSILWSLPYQALLRTFARQTHY